MHASVAQDPRGTPVITLDGMRQGVVLSLPFVPGLLIFAAAFGTAAAQRGLTALEAAMMSGLIYAGASQFVVLEVWSRPLTATSILAMVGVVCAVNMRLFLMGASLRPWMGGLPTARSYSLLSLLVDANWIVAMRYRREGGADAGVFLGAGVFLWLLWVPATWAGHRLGALVEDPHALAIDMVMPAVFTAMLVSLWRGARDGLPWIVAGLASLAAAYLLGGYWFIVVGGLAGCLAAAVRDD